MKRDTFKQDFTRPKRFKLEMKGCNAKLRVKVSNSNVGHMITDGGGVHQRSKSKSKEPRMETKCPKDLLEEMK